MLLYWRAIPRQIVHSMVLYATSRILGYIGSGQVRERFQQ